MLAEAREYWQNWKPFDGKVSLKLPGPHGDFLVACARNIQQAREVKGGKLTFQVGPTVYRGLWVVDGNFLLEAARYLGYDAAAQQGLEATWQHQQASGGVFAGGGPGMWKDTGIAMFTLVRQAELSQDWSYFRSMQPNVARAVKFLKPSATKPKTDGSVNGRYGLLAPGMGDGGLGGMSFRIHQHRLGPGGIEGGHGSHWTGWAFPTRRAPSRFTPNCARRFWPPLARRCAAILTGSSTCPCW